MLINANCFTPKSAEIFDCKNCDVVCSKKIDYVRHILTRKHKNANNAKIQDQFGTKL